MMSSVEKIHHDAYCALMSCNPKRKGYTYDENETRSEEFGFYKKQKIKNIRINNSSQCQPKRKSVPRKALSPVQGSCENLYIRLDDLYIQAKLPEKCKPIPCLEKTQYAIFMKRSFESMIGIARDMVPRHMKHSWHEIPVVLRAHDLYYHMVMHDSTLMEKIQGGDFFGARDKTYRNLAVTMVACLWISAKYEFDDIQEIWNGVSAMAYIGIVKSHKFLTDITRAELLSSEMQVLQAVGWNVRESCHISQLVDAVNRAGGKNKGLGMDRETIFQREDFKASVALVVYMVSVFYFTSDPTQMWKLIPGIAISAYRRGIDACIKKTENISYTQNSQSPLLSMDIGDAIISKLFIADHVSSCYSNANLLEKGHPYHVLSRLAGIHTGFIHPGGSCQSDPVDLTCNEDIGSGVGSHESIFSNVLKKTATA